MADCLFSRVIIKGQSRMWEQSIIGKRYLFASLCKWAANVTSVLMTVFQASHFSQSNIHLAMKVLFIINSSSTLHDYCSCLTSDPHFFFFLLKLNVLYFKITSNIQKSSQNSYIPFNLNTQLLTFYHICPIVSSCIHTHTMWLCI